MLRWTNCFFNTYVFQLQKYLPSSVRTPVSHLSKTLPDHILENICEQYGSLVSFMKLHPTDFIVSKAVDGTWEARSIKPIVERLALQVGSLATLPQSDRPQRQMKNSPRSVRRKRIQEMVASPLWQAAKITSSTSSEGIKTAARVFVQSLGDTTAIVQHPTSGDLWLSVIERSVPIVSGGEYPSLDVRNANGNVTVKGYEALRFARFLSCEEAIPLEVLEEIAAPYVSVSVTTMTLSLPDRFVPTYADLDEEKLQCPLLPSTEGDLHQNNIRQFNALVYQEALRNQHSLKRVLGLKYTNYGQIGRSERLSKLSLKELMSEERNLRDQMRSKRGNTNFSLRVAIKAIKKEYIQRQYPFGTPYFDSDVLALFAYDMLQGTSKIDSREVLRMIEKSGMPHLPLSSNFFTRFPTLFHLEEPVPGQFYISRQGDAAMSLNEHPLQPLSRAEVTLEILTTCHQLTRNASDPITLPLDIVALHLRKLARAAIMQHYGKIKTFFMSYPESFHMSSLDSRGSGSDVFVTTHAKLHALTNSVIPKVTK